MVFKGSKRKRESEVAKPERQLKGKRKRRNELAKQEQQLEGKRARSDELQQRQEALFEDAGEQEVVFKKKSKHSKTALESNLQGAAGEHELNPNDSGKSTHNEPNLDLNSSGNGLALNYRSSMDEQVMDPECRGNGHSESSKEGQQFNSKRHKKEKKSNSERSSKEQQSLFNSSEKEGNDRGIQGQELHDANDNNEKTPNVSTDAKEKKKKKYKKKRDRWGQVLNDANDTNDTFYDGKDAAMLHTVDKPEIVALEGGAETLTEHDSHEGGYDNRTVCAGGMPYDTSEEDIRLFFGECGSVACVVCMKFADTQRFKGLAFITFETETAASKALSLDGANMGDRLIKVEKARAGGKVLRPPPKREAGSLSVYVGNLYWNIKKIDIKRFFKGCDIDDVRLAVDKSTGNFRGYGHVDFSDEKSLAKAITMNQKPLMGRPVKVSYAVRKGFKGNSS